MSDRIQLKRPVHTGDTQSSQSIFTPVKPSFTPTNQPTQVPPLGHDFSRISIQPKLTVSQPDDPYEREADRVAGEVMRMGDPMMAGGGVMRSRQDTIHRQCAACEDEEEVQTKLVDSVVQRKVMVMRSPGGGFQAGGNVESRLSSSKGGGCPLPDDVRSFMEPRFGMDFSKVRVHTGGESVQMNRDLNAQAFVHKQDIYFGAGKAPAKDALTAHELTHVVQQTGAVQTKEVSTKPNIQLKCSACDEEAEVQRSLKISSVSETEVQRSWFVDDDEKEPEESSGGGVLDWAKEQASEAIDSVTQAGGDAYDWAKEKGGEVGGSIAAWGGEQIDGANTAISDLGSNIGNMLPDVFNQTSATTAAMSESIHPEEQDAEDALEQDDLPCSEIIRHIETLIEQLVGRYNDLIKYKGGDKGHQERFAKVQKILAALMVKAIAACKNGEYDSELAEEAQKWRDKQLQVQLNDSPSTEPSYREKIAEALRKAGVPAAVVGGLVVLIIVALADPEPFSKVVLLIGTAAAVAFFVLIGRQSDIPSSTATTALGSSINNEESDSTTA